MLFMFLQHRLPRGLFTMIYRSIDEQSVLSSWEEEEEVEGKVSLTCEVATGNES